MTQHTLKNIHKKKDTYCQGAQQSTTEEVKVKLNPPAPGSRSKANKFNNHYYR